MIYTGKNWRARTGPLFWRACNGPVTGPLRAQNPLRARYNGPVTGPL